MESIKPITNYIDPIIETLQKEIVLLEEEIVRLECERSECEVMIRHFSIMMQKEVGHILEEILRIKREYTLRHKDESEFSESEYEKAEKRYEDFMRGRKESEQYEKTACTLNEEDQAKLKKLYRQTAFLCHPDRVDIPFKDKASEFFKKLNEAYQNQDIETIESLYEQAKTGIFETNIHQSSNKDSLLRQRDECIKKRGSLMSEIMILKASEAWKISNGDIPLEEYFRKLSVQLEMELITTKNLYE